MKFDKYFFLKKKRHRPYFRFHIDIKITSIVIDFMLFYDCSVSYPVCMSYIGKDTADKDVMWPQLYSTAIPSLQKFSLLLSAHMWHVGLCAVKTKRN